MMLCRADTTLKPRVERFHFLDLAEWLVGLRRFVDCGEILLNADATYSWRRRVTVDYSRPSRAGAVLPADIVLVAVATPGIGLTFAAVALARGAEALGGVGEGEGGEEEKRGSVAAMPRRGGVMLGPRTCVRKGPRSPCARGDVARGKGCRLGGTLASQS